MKLTLVLAVFMFFCKSKAFSQIYELNVLEKAFFNISRALVGQDHLVTIVVGSALSDKMVHATFASTAGIPHAVVRLKNGSRMFHLNSSAIILLDTIQSLESFYNRAILPGTFLMSQQLVVYCRDGTADKIASIAMSIKEKEIIQYSYFVIDEEKSVRFLTFIWYTPEGCAKPQLVEVNKFDKSLARWRHGNFKIDKFTTFHGCQINFLFVGGMPEFTPDEIDHEIKAITKCHGYACALVEDLSSSLNYT